MEFTERLLDDPADRHRPVGLMSKILAPFLLRITPYKKLNFRHSRVKLLGVGEKKIPAFAGKTPF